MNRKKDQKIKHKVSLSIFMYIEIKMFIWNSKFAKEVWHRCGENTHTNLLIIDKCLLSPFHIGSQTRPTIYQHHIKKICRKPVVEYFEHVQIFFASHDNFHLCLTSIHVARLCCDSRTQIESFGCITRCIPRTIALWCREIPVLLSYDCTTPHRRTSLLRWWYLSSACRKIVVWCIYDYV